MDNNELEAKEINSEIEEIKSVVKKIVLHDPFRHPIPNIPEGMEYGFVRTTILLSDSPKDALEVNNLREAFEKGYRPVPASRHPEWMQECGLTPMGGSIQPANHILCEKPAEPQLTRLEILNNIENQITGAMGLNSTCYSRHPNKYEDILQRYKGLPE